MNNVSMHHIRLLNKHPTTLCRKRVAYVSQRCIELHHDYELILAQSARSSRLETCKSARSSRQISEQLPMTANAEQFVLDRCPAGLQPHGGAPIALGKASAALSKSDARQWRSTRGAIWRRRSPFTDRSDALAAACRLASLPRASFEHGIRSHSSQPKGQRV